MIDNKFTLISYLGKGGSSKVFLAKNEFGCKWAIKIIRKDKKYPTEVADKMLKREHKMLSLLKSHPNIIDSYGINLDGFATMDDECEKVKYNVIEFAENGPLSNFIRYTGAIEEDISRLLIVQLWSAVEFMHLQGYAHLDIKLENILLDEFYNVKLADMGGSLWIKDSNGYVDRRRGTTLYMAPEVISFTPGDVYNALKADIYSLGVAIFVMLIGEFPKPSDFSSNWVTNGSDETHISKSEWWSVSKKVKLRWKQLSKEIQQLIWSMIHSDPDQRPSISDVLAFSWLSRDIPLSMINEIYNEMFWRKQVMTRIFREEDCILQHAE